LAFSASAAPPPIHPRNVEIAIRPTVHLFKGGRIPQPASHAIFTISPAKPPMHPPTTPGNVAIAAPWTHPPAAAQTDLHAHVPGSSPVHQLMRNATPLDTVAPIAHPPRNATRPSGSTYESGFPITYPNRFELPTAYPTGSLAKNLPACAA